MKFNLLTIPLLVGIIILLFVTSYSYFSSVRSAWQQSPDLRSKQSEMPNILKMLQSVDFEVFGIVQGKCQFSVEFVFHFFFFTKFILLIFFSNSQDLLDWEIYFSNSFVKYSPEPGTSKYV